MDELMTILVGAGMSFVTGVITWWITRTHGLLDEKRRLKHQMMTCLISNRYDLRGDPFTSALNGAAVVFADSEEVRTTIRAFHDAIVAQQGNEIANEKLLDMFRAMLMDLDLPVGDFTDKFLLTPFNIRS